MDFVRQQLAVVQERLAALSASQKLLTAALAVILVMTMLYWGRASATRDVVAVLPNALAGDDLAGVTNALRARGIEFTVDNGKVMVAADKQVEAMGELTFSQALPANANPLDTMFDKVGAFDSSGIFDVRVGNARQQAIVAMIRTWPGVRQANVLITEGQPSRLARRDPRIAINITTRGVDADRRKLAASARALAVNCVAGLDPKFMSVTVDSQPFNGDAAGPGGGIGGDTYELVRQFETAEATKLREQFSSIPGLLVQVTAEMDTTKKTEKRYAVDPKNKIAEVNDSQHETSTPVGSPAAAVEPGVAANTGLDARPVASSAAGLGSGVATDKLNEKTLVDYGRVETQTDSGPTVPHVVGATVGIPRSFFIQIWRQSQPTVDLNARPSEDQLATFIEAQTKQFRDVVKSLTKIKAAEDITVRDYWDLEPIVGGPTLALASPTAAADLTLLATGHAKEVAVGVLAIASLFMVSRMVKKAAPASLALAGVGGLNLMIGDDDGIETVGAPAKRRPPPKAIGGEDIAAEVGDGGAVMFGHELDADVLETSQMIEQVAGFVKANPDAAAQMIGRWMSRD